MIADLPPDDRLARLRLARTEGIGPITFTALIERHGTGAAALRALAKEAGREGSRRFSIPSPAAVEAEVAALAHLDAQLLLKDEPAYPPLLASLPDAPPAITVRGDAGLLSRPAVALVGARNASANGRGFARRLGRELAAAGLVVVSGLARGIDTAVHEGALQAGGGGTVAVIATGVDIAYPPENAELMARIVEIGAVVSERPPGAAARAKDFPRRNRIIAGLALATLVVEAAPSSGSLITARLAADYGREVLAVPGSPLDPRHKGTNQLLREGAHLIESAQDVLDIVTPLLARADPPLPRARPATRPTAARAAAVLEPSPASAEPSGEGLAEQVARALGPEPLAVDELIRECHAAAPDVQAALLELELAGRIDRHPGNRVSLRAG